MTPEVATDMPLLDAALAYRDAGLSVIATRRDKRPVMAWKEYQATVATDDQLADMFLDNAAESVGVVCGAVSGNLECLDFDAGGEAFAPWMELVAADDPTLPDNLVVAATPSGGRHVVYRCPDAAIPGSQKLAMRGRDTVLIETRGEGGYFCAAPSPGYALLQGDLARVPDLAPAERDILIRSARFLNEAAQPSEPPAPVKTAMPGSAGHYRPGDDFNHRCDQGALAGLLSRHGWRFWRQNGPNAAWTRPGKEKGISATVRDVDGVAVFYVFTSSSPFDPMRGYSPFQVYATLEHDGDFARAAAELNRLGYGASPDDGFDVDAFAVRDKAPAEAVDDDDVPTRVEDPGPFPDSLLRYPGFLADFAEHINRRAVKRQPVIALGAAIAALGTLTGRKVEGVTGLRTNFYVLGVADSGDGKDKPREVVRQLLYESGNEALYTSDRLKSDAGIRSALELNPCTLFLLDEIGELLEAIKNARNSPWLKNIITELLTLYSSAQASGVKLGGYADAKRTLTVDCPHVCLFGTSVPRSVFRSMTMDSLTGGLLGRILIFESASENPRKQLPAREPLPPSVLEAARWWRDFLPGGLLTGNHAGSTAAPMLVGEAAEATRIFDRLEERARGEIIKLPAEMAGPYKRVEENARKLGVLAACSECREAPFIGEKAATWASELSFYLTRRLVYLASINVAENDVHEKRNRVFRIIQDTKKKGIDRSTLISRCRFLKAKELSDIIETLAMADEIVIDKVETCKRTKTKLYSAQYRRD